LCISTVFAVERCQSVCLSVRHDPVGLLYQNSVEILSQADSHKHSILTILNDYVEKPHCSLINRTTFAEELRRLVSDSCASCIQRILRYVVTRIEFGPLSMSYNATTISYDTKRQCNCSLSSVKKPKIATYCDSTYQ